MKLYTVCYVKNDEKTLMIHRIKKQMDTHYGKWIGLGGKFELGETPEECAIREVKEESGLDVRDPQLKGLLTFPNFDGRDDWYVFVFIMREFTGCLIDSPEGELKWIADKELLDLNLWEGDRVFLPWLNEGRFFSAKFNYKDGRLVDYQVSFH